MAIRRVFFITAVLVVLSAGSLYSLGAEEVGRPAYVQFPQALGFQYGEISGSGLSYHLWRDSIGFQVAGGIVYIPLHDDYWYDRTLDYSVGTEMQLRVYGEDFDSWLSGQLYGFAGINHGGYIPIIEVTEATEIGDEFIPPELAAGAYTPTFGLGIGIGIEIILFRHFSIPIELGYGLEWTPTAGNAGQQFNIDLRPQAAFRYRY